MSAPEEMVVTFSDFQPVRVEPDATTNPMTDEDLYLIARVIPDLERFDYPSRAPPVVVEEIQDSPR
jgi:hypothetical protein